jgi:hypothetical protein
MADSPNTTPMPADPPTFSRRRLLGRLATSAAAGAVTTLPVTPLAVAADADDARLLAAFAKRQELEAEYMRLMDRPQEDWGTWHDELWERIHVVDQLIILTPARTIAGLHAKARVLVEFCYGGEEFDAEYILDARTTHMCIGSTSSNSMATAFRPASTAASSA